MKHLWIWASVLSLAGYAKEAEPNSSYFDQEHFSEIELVMEELNDEPLIAIIEEDWNFEAPMQFQSEGEKKESFLWNDEENDSDDFAFFNEKKGAQDFAPKSSKKSSSSEEMAKFQPSYEQLPEKKHRFQLESQDPESHLSLKKEELIKPEEQSQPAALQPLPPKAQGIPKGYTKPDTSVKKIPPVSQKPRNNPGVSKENGKIIGPKSNNQRKAPRKQAQPSSKRQKPQNQMTRKYHRQKPARSESSLEE